MTDGSGGTYNSPCGTASRPPPPITGDDGAEFAERLGALIRRRRVGLGLSQETLASGMNLRQVYVSKWETGLAAPNAERLITLAQLLHISDIADLFELLEPRDEAPESPCTAPMLAQA